MQPRQINVLKINKNPSDSFLLFNLLTSHIEPTLSAETIHELGETQIKLSHSLRRVNPTLDGKTSMERSIYFEVGEDKGRLYQLALGLCYYETEHLPERKCRRIDRTSISKRYNDLSQLESDFYKVESAFPSPMRLDFDRLLADSFFLTQEDNEESVKFARRMVFYTAKMKEARKWALQSFKMEAFHDLNASKLLMNFMLSTNGIDFFPHDYAYPFQGMSIKFENTFIRRQRRQKNDACFDFLARVPMEEGKEASIYQVIGRIPQKPPREKPYTLRLYKASPAVDLTVEYKRIKKYAPYLGAKNGHASFFSQRHCGPDLVAYATEKVRPLLENKAGIPAYILEMLRLSTKAFEGLAHVMGTDVHGDIKPSNLLATQQGHVLPIDFEGTSKFTTLYASPERLMEDDEITHKSDVFSLMRSLVYVWGDNHPIWDFNDSSIPENSKAIARLILQNDLQALLADIKRRLDFWEKRGYLTPDEKNKLYDLFLSGHQFNPDNRPSAGELAVSFRALYLAYAKRYDEKDSEKAPQPTLKAGL